MRGPRPRCRLAQLGADTRIADALSADDPDKLSMCIAPSNLLCGNDLQAREIQESQGRFAELRELCIVAGDNVSLAIGMSAVATEALSSGRAREAAQLSSQQARWCLAGPDSEDGH